MKKLFMTIIILFIMYLGIQFAFNFFGKGNTWQYQIVNDNITLDVVEISHLKIKDNVDNYYFKVSGKHDFTFQIYYNFNRSNRIIQDIAYYSSDTIECIYPIFKKNKQLTDVMCYYDGNFTYYYNIKGKDGALDSFVNRLFDYSPYVDSAAGSVVDKMTIYKDNLIENHYIGISNYTGLFDISRNFNSSLYNIKLYNSDIYNPKLSAYNNEFYISADYNSQYEFKDFNVVDMIHLNTETIHSNNAISLDSYIQGVVDDKVYLYDKDNKTQYEINIPKKTVVKVGQNGNIKNYQNGTWTTMTESEANNELKFSFQTNDYNNSKYDRIDKVGQEVGYYYLYEKYGNIYRVYRKNIQDDTIFYLFDTQNIDQIVYENNYVYYIDKDTVKVFHDQFGVKKIATYSELEFNRNIYFYVQEG